MNIKLRVLLLVLAVLAFTIVFSVNYFLLKMSGFLSVSGALGFTILLTGWAGYRYKRYVRKTGSDRPGRAGADHKNHPPDR